MSESYEVKYLIPSVGCWVLGVGCWVLGVGCWVLGVGCWPDYKKQRYTIICKRCFDVIIKIYSPLLAINIYTIT
ncbi:hypothetical protein EX237_14130 [Providencia rettgeri]|nr:hypothetical protein [Providencia rettgeri]